MIDKYMDMLVECLEKKNQILDSLAVVNKKQTNGSLSAFSIKNAPFGADKGYIKRNDPRPCYLITVTVEGHFFELLVSNIIGYLAFVE